MAVLSRCDMLLGLHGICILHTNVLTDIRVARDTGYDALEIWVPKLERYLEAGHRLEDLPAALGPVQPATVNCLQDLGHPEPEPPGEPARRCEQLCAIANTLNCSILQVSTARALLGMPWPEIRKRIAQSLAELADIAAPFGLRLVLEPQTFAPLRTPGQALEIFETAGRDNVGLCLDTFHLWTGGTSWEEVAALDSDLIHVVHISDVTPRKGEEWADDDRDVLPGDGILPLKEATAAVCATGYDGLWSVELMGAKHWEWDPVELARELKRRTESLLAD